MIRPWSLRSIMRFERTTCVNVHNQTRGFLFKLAVYLARSIYFSMGRELLPWQWGNECTAFSYHRNKPDLPPFIKETKQSIFSIVLHPFGQNINSWVFSDISNHRPTWVPNLTGFFLPWKILNPTIIYSSIKKLCNFNWKLAAFEWTNVRTREPEITSENTCKW